MTTPPLVQAGSPGVTPKQKPQQGSGATQKRGGTVAASTPAQQAFKQKQIEKQQKVDSEKVFTKRQSQTQRVGAQTVPASKVDKSRIRALVKNTTAGFVGKADRAKAELDFLKSTQSAKAVRDIVKEGLSIGKIETETFNKDDLERAYDKTRANLELHYTAQKQKLEEDGYDVTESQKEWVDSIIGPNKQAFVSDVLAAAPKLSTLLKETGKNSIPVYGTQRTWKDSSNWTRGASVASDLLFLLPLVGQVGSATRAGAGVGRTVSEVGIATLKSPITLVTRPKATLKATAKDVAGRIETAVDPRKLPIDAVELKTNTIRVPVDKFDSPLSATRARDVLTSQAISGKKAAVELGGSAVSIPRAAINKVSPVAVHATPDIRPFLNGAVIEYGKEGGLFFAPNLHSVRTISSAFGISKLPGVKVPGALLVRDARILSKLQRTGKIYKGDVEIEAILKAGETLPKPSQILFTRNADGSKIALAVIGKPFTRAEIGRLKLLGSADSITNIFKPRFSARRIKASEAYVANTGKLDDLVADLKSAKASNNRSRVERTEQQIRRVQEQMERDARIAGGLGVRGGTVFGGAAYVGRQDIDRAISELGRAPAKPDRRTQADRRTRKPDTADRTLQTKTDDRGGRGPFPDKPAPPVTRIPQAPSTGKPSRPFTKLDVRFPTPEKGKTFSTVRTFDVPFGAVKDIPIILRVDRLKGTITPRRGVKGGETNPQRGLRVVERAGRPLPVTEIPYGVTKLVVSDAGIDFQRRNGRMNDSRLSGTRRFRPKVG